MNLFKKYVALLEGKSTLYGQGNKYTARVYQNRDGSHVAKFFNNGTHMAGADYQHKDSNEVHEFAQEEVEHRRKQVADEKNKISERILPPQGREEFTDKITHDSDNEKGAKKKQMGNHTPLEIISKILAGK